MVSNLSSSLNNLVSNGIISPVDAAAISGGAVGKGATGVTLPGQPKQDEFVKPGVASWKKAATGVLLAGLATFVGIKYKDKIVERFNKTFHKNPVVTTATNTAAATTAASVPKESLITRIRSTITSYVEEAKTKFPNAIKKLESVTTFVKEKWNAIPKGVKIGGGIAAGLLALLALGGHKSPTPTVPTAAATPTAVPTETPVAAAPTMPEPSVATQLPMDKPLMVQPPVA